MSKSYHDQDDVDLLHRMEQLQREKGIPHDDATQVGSLFNSQSCYTETQDTQDTQEKQETQDSQETERKTTCCIGNTASDLDSLSAEQPLGEYIQAAAGESQERLACQEYGDPWMTPLWHFTWLVKGHPALVKLTATEAMEQIEPMLMEYAKVQCFENLEDPFEVFGNTHGDGSRLEFLTTWGKVRYSPGWTPLHYAEEQAGKQPHTPPICRNGKMPEYASFVSFAGWLQVGVGNRNILLPCETLAAKFGNKMSVSRLRQLAKADGYLAEVKTHRFRSKGKSEATEFRFNVAVDPMFLKEAVEGCDEAFQQAKIKSETLR